MKDNINKILLIILAINLAITCTLAVLLVTSTSRLHAEQEKLAEAIEEIEVSEGDSEDAADSLAVMGGLFMRELEGKVDEITQDLKDEIAEQVDEINAEIQSEIASVEQSITKYDEDIQTIASSLEELNESMKEVNEVVVSVQEILDSIKKFLKID